MQLAVNLLPTLLAGWAAYLCGFAFAGHLQQLYSSYFLHCVDLQVSVITISLLDAPCTACICSVCNVCACLCNGAC